MFGTVGYEILIDVWEGVFGGMGHGAPARLMELGL
jgi:hypothetical protein